MYFQTLDNKNYIIQLSERHLYFFITEPIEIKIYCENTEYEHKIKTSSEFTLRENCEIYRGKQNTPNIKQSIFNTNVKMHHPNLKTYNFVEQKWNQNVTIIPKHELKHIEIKTALKNVQIEANSIKQSLNNISFTPTFDILEWLGIKNFIYESLIILATITISLLLICICTKQIIKKLFK